MRNIVWGILTSVAAWAQLAVGMALAALFVTELREEMLEWGAQLFLALFLAALISGLIIGVLRGFARTGGRRRLVGGLVTSVVFLTQFAVLGGRELFQSAGQVIVIVIATFGVGALMSPLFTSRLLLIDVDAILGGIWHADSGETS